MPAGPAQLVLVALIYTGHTCYCYRRQQPGRPWFVYIRDLEEVRGQLNGSVPLDEWARDYAAILATFYSEPVVVDADARLRLSDGQACQ